MPAKFKKKFKSEMLSGKAKNVTDEMKKEFAIRVKMFIKSMILDAIQKGISPVNMRDAYPKNTGGKSRYIQYSDSYKKKIKRGGEDMMGKRQRPINLKLSGKMLNSLKAKITKNEKVTVWFTDEKAKYHDKEGAGKSKVLRRLLPRGVEEFNRAIQRKIIDAAGEAVKDLL
jgi:hypothetical protein